MIDFIVVVPIFNTCPDHLLECVTSILNQTIEVEFKIDLLNDGSDNTETIRMIKYLSKNKRINVINLKENVGESAALNYYHKITTQKYIAICDSDDVMDKNKLKLQVEWLENNPETDVLSTNLFAFDNSDITRKELFKTYHDIYCEPANNFWIANHGTVIYKNRSVKDAGGYNENIRSGQDTDLWKRMYENECKFQCLPDILYAWRRYF